MPSEPLLQTKVQYGYKVPEDSIIIDRSYDGSYTINYTQLASSKYLLLWLPSATFHYLNKIEEKNYYEAKSLNTYWVYQRAPLVQFSDVSQGMQIVQFKSQLLTIETVGTGQSDDDQIFFSYNRACHVSYMKGPILIRKNNKYQQVWMGEEVGIKNLVDDTNNCTVLYYCWRPAATSRYIPYDQEEWKSLRSVQFPDANAAVYVDNIDANKALAEVTIINPPMSNPILLKGTKIVFSISQCTRKRMSPALNGVIEIWHILYTSNNQQLYNSEIAYRIAFDQDYCATRYSVGALVWNSECTFTFDKINDDFWMPGETYMLVIYPKTFTCCNCQNLGYSSDYFFGNLYQASQPIFQYRFTYQD